MISNTQWQRFGSKFQNQNFIAMTSVNNYAGLLDIRPHSVSMYLDYYASMCMQTIEDSFDCKIFNRNNRIVFE